jgi:hypothetical protein
MCWVHHPGEELPRRYENQYPISTGVLHIWNREVFSDSLSSTVDRPSPNVIAQLRRTRVLALRALKKGRKKEEEDRASDSIDRLTKLLSPLLTVLTVVGKCRSLGSDR